jgi:hypothetical protein
MPDEGSAKRTHRDFPILLVQCEHECGRPASIEWDIVRRRGATCKEMPGDLHRRSLRRLHAADVPLRGRPRGCFSFLGSPAARITQLQAIPAPALSRMVSHYV